VFAAAWTVTSAMAAHPPRIVEVFGATPAQAVFAGMMIGPAQVAARIMEAGLLKRFHPLVSTRPPEGIISKRADAPYRSERNENWLKIKAVQKGKFPVVGFVKDPSGVAALYLGKQEGKGIVYMGKVGTGWSRTVSSQIRKQLDSVVSPKSKLTRPIRKPKATWVEPKFYADVEYRDITSEGLLRASSFKGLIKGTGRT